MVQLRVRQAEKLSRVADRIAAQPCGAQQRIVVGHSKGRMVGAPPLPFSPRSILNLRDRAQLRRLPRQRLGPTLQTVAPR